MHSRRSSGPIYRVRRVRGSNLNVVSTPNGLVAAVAMTCGFTAPWPWASEETNPARRSDKCIGNLERVARVKAAKRRA